ncbi:hypothetical protein [Oceanisphaera sp. W20_SRM_FM3]|uniref:hypothetical protein n=1 Tax=Oceanisphaera sp. W20_SRM_FM3 TaxID=3240267 RepID=UPI003F954BE3
MRTFAMRTLTIRSLFSALLLGSLLGLSGCEPKGPAADIGDNINQVKDEAPATEANAPEPATSGQLEPVNLPEQPIRPVRDLPLETKPSVPVTDNTVPSTNSNAANPVDSSEQAEGTTQQQPVQPSELNNVVTEEIDQKLDQILKETSDQH